jgi:hypothetical protein
LFTRDVASSLRSAPLAILALVATSFLAGRAALADEPLVTSASAVEPAIGTDPQSRATAPVTSDGYLVVFEKPGAIWHDAPFDLWTLKDSKGKVICELPCTSRVRYPWNVYVEGSAKWPDVPPDPTLRLALADTLVDSGFLVQNKPIGKTLWARPNPGRGCADCALGLGIASGVALAGGVGLLALFAANDNASGAANDHNLAIAVFGLGGAAFLGLVAISFAVTALVWGGWSERPHVQVFGAPPPSGSPPPVRVSFASSGLVLSF